LAPGLLFKVLLEIKVLCEKTKEKEDGKTGLK
jgi:hypothetical protein